MAEALFFFSVFEVQESDMIDCSDTISEIVMFSLYSFTREKHLL